MAKLSTTRRNKLPASVFAGPGRTYPLTDVSHANAAIRDSAHAENVGNITARERARIVAAADRYKRAHGAGKQTLKPRKAM